MHDCTLGLQSHQRALAIRIKLFGEDNKSTVDSCRELVVTQHENRDYTLAVQPYQRALAICIKLFVEEHERIAASYREIGATQHYTTPETETTPQLFNLISVH